MPNVPQIRLQIWCHSSQNSGSFFCGNWQGDSKTYVETQGTKNRQDNQEEKRTSLKGSDFQISSYYKATRTKMVWNWLRGRQIVRQNRNRPTNMPSLRLWPKWHHFAVRGVGFSVHGAVPCGYPFRKKTEYWPLLHILPPSHIWKGALCLKNITINL